MVFKKLLGVFGVGGIFASRRLRDEMLFVSASESARSEETTTPEDGTRGTRPSRRW